MNKGGVNVYEREKLYEEVWNAPVTQVAKSYGVSDVAIRKICRSMKIPTPSNGYWTKLRHGKPVKRPPLPLDYDGETTKTGIDPNAPKNIVVQTIIEPLSFLTPSERENFQKVTLLFKMDPDKALNKEVLNYNSNKNILNYAISEKEHARAHKIFNGLVYGIKQLGYSLHEDLSFCIRGEVVSFSLVECQSKIKHDITPEEKAELDNYNKAKMKHEWGVRKPYIPMYDRQYNGVLSFNTMKHSCIRDTDKIKLENRIPDLISQLIQQSEILRNERLEREATEKERIERERRCELLKEEYNNDIDKLILLIKESNDFEIATKIRDYIWCIEQKDHHHEKAEWIEWAKEKADWYDPTIDKPDKILGRRLYGSEIIPRKRSSYYYW